MTELFEHPDKNKHGKGWKKLSKKKKTGSDVDVLNLKIEEGRY